MTQATQPPSTNLSVKIIWVGLLLYATYGLAHMTPFMVDAEKKSNALGRTVRELADEELAEPFFRNHNCFTCYIIADYLATEGVENIFLREHYRDTEMPTPIHELIGDTLEIDTYQYPPPFLLLPKLLTIGGHDFFTVRTIWFFVNVLLFIVTAVILIRWLAPPAFCGAWFMIPMVLAAPVTLVSMQIGNVHFFILVLTVLGMLLLERQRYVLGSLALGYVIVAKIFPGVLLAYLVFRRKWRAVIGTGVAMVGYCLLTLAIFGVTPFRAFIDYQVPRLSSGEAFWFAKSHSGAILANTSVMGAIYKLNRLELLGSLDADKLASMVVLLYSVVLVVIVAILGLRHGRMSVSNAFQEMSGDTRLGLARTWVLLLVLAQMRSPFLPYVYGNIAILWLLALLVPTIGRSWMRRAVLLVSAWIVFANHVPLPFGPPEATIDFCVSLGAFVVVLVPCGALVFRSAQIGETSVEPAVPTC